MPPHDEPKMDDHGEHRAEAVVSTDFDPSTARRLKRSAGIVLIVLAVAFVGMAIFRMIDAHALAKSTDAAAGAAPLVDTVIAKTPLGGQGLVLPGQTAAWYETTIYARVNGYVAKWLVDIGDQVRKDQVLATIETPELDAELSAAKAQLEASRSQVAARRAETEFAKSTNERWRDSPTGVVSEQEKAAKKADFESAQARLYAAQAQVALDQSRVNQYAAMTEFKQVRAPFDGIITERTIDVGNLVTAGSSSSTTSLYHVSQTDPLRVFVDVPQSAAAELMHDGTPVEVRTANAGGAVFQGTIARSSGVINVQARTMRVEVDLPNKQHPLVPGMYVNVAFQLAAKGLVEVPAAALVFRSKGAEVAKVNPNGTVDFVEAVIARDDGSMVELASGAKAGDRLVLNISSQIAQGQRVALSNSGPDDSVKAAKD